MERINRNIRFTALVLSLLTLLWLVLMMISMSQVGNWSFVDYVQWTAHPDLPFILNYINAVLITIIAVILYAFVYDKYRRDDSPWPVVALVFTGIYGMLNLVAYSLQISVVPRLSAYALSQDHIPSEHLHFVVSQLIQADPHSVLGYINGLAYAVLGIPSIIFGTFMIRDKKRFSGAFLLLNGILCVAGLMGYMLDNFLSMGIMAGGAVFLIACITMVFDFRGQSV